MPARYSRAATVAYGSSTRRNVNGCMTAVRRAPGSTSAPNRPWIWLCVSATATFDSVSTETTRPTTCSPAYSVLPLSPSRSASFGAERLQLDLLARRARREESRLHDAAVVVDLARDEKRRTADRGGGGRAVGPIGGAVERVRHRDLQQAGVEFLAAFQQPRLGRAAFGVRHGDRIRRRELHDVKRRHDETVGAAADGVAGAELQCRRASALGCARGRPKRHRRRAAVRRPRQRARKSRLFCFTVVTSKFTETIGIVIRDDDQRHPDDP